MRKVRQIKHEAGHDIEHNAKFVSATAWEQVYKLLGKAAHWSVTQGEILKKHQNARHQAKHYGKYLNWAESTELDTLWSVKNLLLQ